MEVITECDKRSMDEFFKIIKLIVKEIREFNKNLMQFLEDQKKIARDLWMLVIRYNVLKSGPPCVYPLIEKEEILSELLVKIQEKTSSIGIEISSLKINFDKLPKLNKVIQKNSLELNWNPTINPLIRGSTKHRAPSEYLEEIADIIFQYDVSITCMQQYFENISLNDSDSYQNLLNSFSISNEIVEAVSEFLIKSSILKM